MKTNKTNKVIVLALASILAIGCGPTPAAIGSNGKITGRVAGCSENLQLPIRIESSAHAYADMTLQLAAEVNAIVGKEAIVVGARGGVRIIADSARIEEHNRHTTENKAAAFFTCSGKEVVMPTTATAALKITLAHELGHAAGLVHDESGGGSAMAPSASRTDCHASTADNPTPEAMCLVLDLIKQGRLERFGVDISSLPAPPLSDDEMLALAVSKMEEATQGADDHEKCLAAREAYRTAGPQASLGSKPPVVGVEQYLSELMDSFCDDSTRPAPLKIQSVSPEYLELAAELAAETEALAGRPVLLIGSVRGVMVTTDTARVQNHRYESGYSAFGFFLPKINEVILAKVGQNFVWQAAGGDTLAALSQKGAKAALARQLAIAAGVAPWADDAACSNKEAECVVSAFKSAGKL